jgi:two-component system, cell cycle response regulator
MMPQDDLPQLLLVEDSDASVDIISRQLGTKYKVIHARNVHEARKELAASNGIQIVVADITALRTQNFELLRRIRATDSVADVAVIALFGQNDQADRAAAFEAGVNDFLHKPLDPIELQARINTHQMLASTLRKLQSNQQSHSEQATTDRLTELTSRRSLLEQGRRYMALSLRNNKDVSVVTLDIDRLKVINEAYGNAVGNEVLAHLGSVLRKAIRAEDVAARVGGEEFAVLLPNADAEGAAVFAERVRASIEQTPIMVNGEPLTITVSLGVASMHDDCAESVEQLLMIADRRLLVAKQTGRNRVVKRSDEPVAKRGAR